MIELQLVNPTIHWSVGGKFGGRTKWEMGRVEGPLPKPSQLQKGTP